jgi:hypothetical protein
METEIMCRLYFGAYPFNYRRSRRKIRELIVFIRLARRKFTELLTHAPKCVFYCVKNLFNLRILLFIVQIMCYFTTFQYPPPPSVRIKVQLILRSKITYVIG